MLDSKGNQIKIRVGGDFEPLPDGKYTCLIQSVKAVSAFNSFKGEQQELVNYRLQVLDDVEMPIEKMTPETTRGRLLWKRCSLSLSKKSWLFKLACAVEGHELTKEELEAFDPEQLVGKQVSCLVAQSVGKDNVTIFNNIMSFSKATKKLKPVEETIVEKESRPAFNAPKLGDAEATDFAGKSEEEIKNMTLDEVLGKE